MGLPDRRSVNFYTSMLEIVAIVDVVDVDYIRM